tara:strand:- start:605 stop:760 length:156 start_codon:yes stop_codon:yes gene_type:complete
MKDDTVLIVAGLGFLGWLCYLSPTILEGVGVILGVIAIIIAVGIIEFGDSK